MTVGETISSSSLVPGSQAPPPVQVVQQPHPPIDPIIVTGVQQSPSLQVVPQDAGSNSGSIRSTTSTHPAQPHPMAAKVNQEILTSLHFIKDIRRLEKYQRDFFLKVKESLTHVHVLLDHQLMDMTWSDNLADCEENLLKCSTCVQTSSSSQLVDAYNILLHDRERLNNRFQELSVKSSLSEFVVNSSQLLDINAVRIAAEAILKGENPIPAQGDQVPVDHTFFLANFCTTSLASSMMASFVPKPVSIHQTQAPNNAIVSGSGGSADPSANSGGYNQTPVGLSPHAPIYDGSPRAGASSEKKINGSLHTPGNQLQAQVPGQAPGRPQRMLSGSSGANNAGSSAAANLNSSKGTVELASPEILTGGTVRGHPSGSGVNTSSGSNQTTSPHTNTNGIDYAMSGNSIAVVAPDFNSSTGTSAAQTASGTASNLANMYDSAGGLDKFLLSAATAKEGTAADRAAVVAAAEMAVSNGMYGHELVAAISQITNQTGSNIQNVTAKSKSPQKPQIDPWGKMAATSEDSGLRQAAANDPSINRSNNSPRGVQPSKGLARTAAVGSGPSNSATAELNLPNDNTSDSVSTASDEGSRGAAVTGSGVNSSGDLGVKPLSFARIASLNLEKQAIQRPNINSNPLGAVAAVQTLGAGQGGSFPPNMASLQVVNNMGSDPLTSQTNTNSVGAGSMPLAHSTASLQMAHGTGISLATSLAGNIPIGQAGSNSGMQSMVGPGGLGAGNGPMLQAAHFSSNTVISGPSQYPLQQPQPHQSQSNSSVGQLQVGGAGMMNQLQGGNQLQQQSSIATHPLMHSLPPSSNPRFYFDITMEGKRLGRVIIEAQPSIAPKMAHNFNQLVTGERGFGYKGCQFFQAWRNESIICGDWEHNSGRGGRAALEGGPLFTPDDTRLPCIRGAVGMRRMSKKHSSLNQVASQFRIILANMNTQFTGIFGHVISGIEALDKVADMGGDGGRPEKTAMVSACGIFKSS